MPACERDDQNGVFTAVTGRESTFESFVSWLEQNVPEMDAVGIKRAISSDAALYDLQFDPEEMINLASRNNPDYDEGLLAK